MQASCRSCGEAKPQSGFGRNQWDRARNGKGGDCLSCQGRADENAGPQRAAKKAADVAAFNNREAGVELKPRYTIMRELEVYCL